MTKGYYAILENRAAVTVTGPEARPFLQGLITQDINLLETCSLLYSALLTPQGKFDFDFFISGRNETILLECEAERADELVKRLSAFKLRKALDITAAPIQVFVAWRAAMAAADRDPRHPDLGYRILGTDLKNFDGFEKTDFAAYDCHRLSLGIPDGSRDFARDEDTVADMGLEKFNGVSFTKGCYMGQELTSRMHHRGLAKKGLYKVTITDDPLPPFTDIVVDNNLIGEMRSSSGNQGLAMLRHEHLKAAERAGLVVR